MKKRIFLLFLIVLILPVSLFGQRRSRSLSSQFTLTVTCNVPNASVIIEPEKGNRINGQATFEQMLDSGNIRITVEADGYISQTRDVNLDSNKTESFTLQPATGRVEVMISGDFLNKKIVNARDQIQVYDNGTLLGGNGLVYELRPGQHTIQIVTGGFMVQKTIQVQAGRVYRLEPVLDIQIR